MSKSTPPPQLLGLVSSFLASNGFEKAAKQVQKQAKDQGVTIPSDGIAADLTDVFQVWEAQKTVAAEKGSSDSSDESEDSDDESSSSDESESDSDSEAEAEAEKPSKKRKAASSSSDSDDSSSASEAASSDSDSSSESEDEAPPPAKKSKTARAASPSASSSSSSSSDDDSSSASSESESSDSESESSSSSDSDSSSSESSSSDSDSSSDSSSSESEAETKKTKKTKTAKPAEKKQPAKKDDKKTKPTKAEPEREPSSSSTATLEGDSTEESTKDTLIVPAAAAEDPAEHMHPDRKRKLPDSFSGMDKTAAIPATDANVKRLKKDNIPFSRIPKDQYVDPRFANNEFHGYDYAARAHEALIVTKGKDFTKAKNKGKRGSYRGGKIDDQTVHGIKFDD